MGGIEMKNCTEEKNHFESVELLFEARAFVYSVLKQAFYVEPSRKFLRALKKDEIVNSLPFCEDSDLIKEGVEEVKKYLGKQDIVREEEFQNLHWDFTRMFIGPHSLPAPPWESSYLNEERLLFQKETLEVRRKYLKYNFVPKNFPHEADDHIGLELDFMGRLSEIAGKKVNNMEITDVIELLEDQKAFLKEHLLKWVPSFSQDIIKSAESDFYKGMAKILKGFLELDIIAIEELLEEVKGYKELA